MMDLIGQVPESWACIDCGINTAPGMMNRGQVEQAFAIDRMDPTSTMHRNINENSEVYVVRAKIWQAAGVKGYDGCLCIGCLEKRIGRKLRPKDFMRNHPFSMLAGTRRLLARRGER